MEDQDRRENTPPRGARGGLIAMLIGSVIGIGGLWIVARHLSWDGLRGALAAADPAPLLAAAAFVVMATWLRAYRWRTMFHRSEPHVTIPGLWRIILVSQFLNIVLPVRAGEVARVYLVKQRFGRDLWETGGTIALEKGLDAIALAALMFAGSIWMPWPSGMAALRTALLVPATVAVVALAAIAAGGKPLVAAIGSSAHAGGLRGRVFGVLATVTTSLVVAQRPAIVARLVVESLAIWTLAALPNYLVLQALGIPIAPASGLVVLIALQLGAALASTPGNIGLFEVICIGALAAFGVGPEQALAYGLLLHATAYAFPVLVGGILAGMAARNGFRPFHNRRTP